MLLMVYTVANLYDATGLASWIADNQCRLMSSMGMHDDNCLIMLVEN